jgi:hypothetical protein
MNQQQAIELIQEVIDKSVKAGLYDKIETAFNVNIAWQVILNNLKKVEVIEPQ